MTRLQNEDPRDGEVVPPPLDTHIPTDDELDALCDRMMRFEDSGVAAEDDSMSRRIARA